MESPIHMEIKFNRTVTPGELITAVINHVITVPSLYYHLTSPLLVRNLDTLESHVYKYSVKMCISNNLIQLNVQKTEIIIFGHTDHSKVLHDSLGPWSGKLQQQVNKIGSSF